VICTILGLRRAITRVPTPIIPTMQACYFGSSPYDFIIECFQNSFLSFSPTHTKASSSQDAQDVPGTGHKEELTPPKWNGPLPASCVGIAFSSCITLVRSLQRCYQDHRGSTRFCFRARGRESSNGCTKKCRALLGHDRGVKFELRPYATVL
jgi:hypothetical protein